MIGVNEIWKNLIMQDSVPDKNQKGKNNCVVLSTYILLESLKHLNFEVLILAWHSLAAFIIMHMWIRVLCKIINQLHRRFLFASWFSKGAVKIISNYTQNYPTILYSVTLPCLVSWKQPHTRLQNYKVLFSMAHNTNS